MPADDLATLRALNKRFIHNFVTNDVALVSATNKWTRVRDGAEVTGMTCYTDTYVREGGRWLCVLARITAVTPENYPPDETIVVRCLRGVRED